MANFKQFAKPEMRQDGYSLIELVIVVSIIMVISAMALPIVTTTLANMKVRSAMSELSSLVQDCRSMAVRKSKTKALHVQIQDNRTVLFMQTAPGTPDMSSMKTGEDKLLYLPPGMALASSGAPAPRDPATIWGADTKPATGDITFNPRGLPCDFSGAMCVAPQGFIQYFSYSANGGGQRWIELTVSPAGRIKLFLWNGKNLWED